MEDFLIDDERDAPEISLILFSMILLLRYGSSRARPRSSFCFRMVEASMLLHSVSEIRDSRG